MKRGFTPEAVAEPPQKRATPPPPPDAAFAAGRGPMPPPEAAMQPRPTQYRLTHTPVPSGSAPYRQLKVEDALTYLDQVGASAFPFRPSL